MAFRLQVPWDHSVGESGGGDKKPHVFPLIPGWTVNAPIASSFQSFCNIAQNPLPQKESSPLLLCVPPARGWDSFLSRPLGACTPQVSLNVKSAEKEVSQ